MDVGCAGQGSRRSHMYISSSSRCSVCTVALQLGFGLTFAALGARRWLPTTACDRTLLQSSTLLTRHKLRLSHFLGCRPLAPPSAQPLESLSPSRLILLVSLPPSSLASATFLSLSIAPQDLPPNSTRSIMSARPRDGIPPAPAHMQAAIPADGPTADLSYVPCSLLVCSLASR